MRDIPISADAARLFEAARAMHPQDIRNWADLARFLGVRDQDLTNWKTRGLPQYKLIPVADQIGCDAKWLKTGAGEMVAGNVMPGPDIRGTVPLINWIQAGMWKNFIDNLEPGEGERIATTYRAKDHTYALRVQGDSMEPRFPQGAILIVEPSENPQPGQFVIVRQSGQEATFKQLVQDGGVYYLKPLNPRYPIMELKPDAQFCGVVKRIEMDV